MTKHPFKYSQGKFTPTGKHPEYKEGQTYYMSIGDERSMKSHRHEFAWIRTAWQNMPEHLTHMPYAKSPEHLRKHALMMCDDERGRFTNQKVYPCETPGEAERWAAHLDPLDEYSLVVTEGSNVVVLTAKSQSVKAMGKKAFQESKTLIMEWISNLIGVTPEELEAA